MASAEVEEPERKIQFSISNKNVIPISKEKVMRNSAQVPKSKLVTQYEKLVRGIVCESCHFSEEENGNVMSYKFFQEFCCMAKNTIGEDNS